MAYAKKLSAEVDYKAKPSHPIAPSPSPEGTVGLRIQSPQYAQEQHDTWRALFERQQKLLEGRVCAEYIEGRAKLEYTQSSVPRLADLSKGLHQHSGWEIVRVEGYVPEPIFFELLADKRFPCTDFLRHPDELEYTPAPDMFHDLMGHLPMITNQRFASFFHSFGLAGRNAKSEEDIAALGRIYWFTVEFGLINPTAHKGAARDPAQTQIYGAGIASSVGEIEYALSDKVKKTPFNVSEIAKTAFDIHHMQTELFEISSFTELELEFKKWATTQGLLPK